MAAAKDGKKVRFERQVEGGDRDIEIAQHVHVHNAHVKRKLLAVSTRHSTKLTAAQTSVQVSRDKVKSIPKVTFALGPNVTSTQEPAKVSKVDKANKKRSAIPATKINSKLLKENRKEISLSQQVIPKGISLLEQVISPEVLQQISELPKPVDSPHLNNIPRNKRLNNSKAVLRRKDRNRTVDRKNKSVLARQDSPTAVPTTVEIQKSTELNMPVPPPTDTVNLTEIFPLQEHMINSPNLSPNIGTLPPKNHILSDKIQNTVPEAYNLTPETLAEIRKHTGLKFTVDLSAQPYAHFQTSENIKHCAIIQQALTHPLQSEEALVYTSRSKAKIILQSYNLAKLTTKDTKAACIIPVCDISKLRSELTSWILVHTLKHKQYTITKKYSGYPP